MLNKPIIISICSEKGGVGKTTTTINLAGGLAKRRKEVLVVDLDQQQNASHALGYVKDGRPTSAELIYNTVAGIPIDYAEAIRTCGNGVDYIPSSPMLTNITGTIANDTENDSNFVLRRLLCNEVFAGYDYILLDCRTILDLLISNALNASNYVIKIISSIDPDVGLMCSSIIKSIREIIGLSDKYDTEWQRMIAMATLIGKIISSIDPDSELICDSVISSINYELQKPIEDDIYTEVIETMRDDFDPGKASEITFKHFEKAYPGFEQFCKEQYGEE